MFLHLGNDVVVAGSDVIAIINIEKKMSPEIKAMIKEAEEHYRLVNVGEKEKNKSLVIGDHKMYISPISSQTLQKRAQNYLKED